MTAPLLVLEHLKKVYSRGTLVRRPTFTLEVDLAFPESRIVGVVGPNGAGKTTLFEMVTGSNAPTEGRVLVAGADIHRVKYKERDRLAIHYHQSYQVRAFADAETDPAPFRRAAIQHAGRLYRLHARLLPQAPRGREARLRVPAPDGALPSRDPEGDRRELPARPRRQGHAEGELLRPCRGRAHARLS